MSNPKKTTQEQIQEMKDGMSSEKEKTTRAFIEEVVRKLREKKSGSLSASDLKEAIQETISKYNNNPLLSDDYEDLLNKLLD